MPVKLSSVQMTVAWTSELKTKTAGNIWEVLNSFVLRYPGIVQRWRKRYSYFGERHIWKQLSLKVQFYSKKLQNFQIIALTEFWK